MAVVLIPDEDRRLEDAADIRAFLDQRGILFERWPQADRVPPDASAEEVLAAYAPEIEALKTRGGYVAADVVDVHPATPNLDAFLEKFSREHTHTEDEVRFILKGRGLFHIHPPAGPVFAIQVEEGDLISVPAHTRHWFHLCGERTIRAIRLFQDKAGWTPHYLDDPVHANYQPVCWGPAYVAGTAEFAAVVRP